MILRDCQSSDMVRIGFLSRIRPFAWCNDLKNMIKDTELWKSDPFQFLLYPGSLSRNKKGAMAPVMMVETEWEKVSTGLDFFCHAFDGDNPLSPCRFSYPFFTLYQNQLSDSERQSIIQDSLRHIGEVDLIHLHGFQNIDVLVTPRQNIKVQLHKLLLGLHANQSNIDCSSKSRKKLIQTLFYAPFILWIKIW